LSGKGAYIKGGKKEGGGMITHGEGGEGGGDGGQGDQQKGGPGGKRVAKKKTTMGIVIYDMMYPYVAS
jgi:hypothetical protein